MNREFIVMKQKTKIYNATQKDSYGYCKLDIRDEKCKLVIFVQGLKYISQSVLYKAYLIPKNNKNLQPLYLGFIPLDKTGKAELKVELNIKNLLNSNTFLEEYGAIAIIISNNEQFHSPLVGFFDELEYEFIDIFAVKKNKEVKVIPKEVKLTPKIEEEKKEEKKEEKVEEKVEEKTEEKVEEKVEEKTEEKVEEKTEDRVAVKDKKFEDNDEKLINNLLELAKLLTKNTEVSYNDSEKDEEIANNKIEEIFNKNTHMMPFDKKSDYEIVRISPDDLNLFYEDSTKLKNNSILISRFSMYKHLILGKRNNEYILGVPDKYLSRNNNYMKSYGFDRFKTCKDIDLKEGEYGYWIKEVK